MGIVTKSLDHAYETAVKLNINEQGKLYGTFNPSQSLSDVEVSNSHWLLMLC